MARYPKAKYRPVSGLKKDPPIIPIGVILHVRAGTGASLFNYFNGPSGGIESHFYLTYDGKWEQYRDTGREADANYHGNSFIINGKRYGFLSVETEGLDKGTWTDVQLDELKQFLLWASKVHKIPLRVTPAWNRAGVGYHTLWGAPGPWTPVAKDCPGPNRIKQFHTDIVPWFSTPEAVLASLDPKDIDRIARAVWSYSYKDRQALSYLVTADINARTSARTAGVDLDVLADKIVQKGGTSLADRAAILVALKDFYGKAVG